MTNMRNLPVAPTRITSHAAIMAAGSGSRLGGDTTKAMQVVGEQPLIEHVLRQFVHANIMHVFVAASSTDMALRRYLGSRRQQRRFDSLEILSVERAAGTAGAVREILTAIGSNPSLLSTVDLVAPALLAKDLCHAGAQADPSVLSIFAVTPQIRGDLQTFVNIAPGGDVVTDFGKEIRASGALYGNIRWFSRDAIDALRDLPEWSSASRDSILMRGLIRDRPSSVRARTYQAIFDIDTPGDILAAESWLAEQVVIAHLNSQTDGPTTGQLPSVTESR
jgi:NDP-sugar pyrophosphorylase family protein